MWFSSGVIKMALLQDSIFTYNNRPVYVKASLLLKPLLKSVIDEKTYDYDTEISLDKIFCLLVFYNDSHPSAVCKNSSNYSVRDRIFTKSFIFSRR